MGDFGHVENLYHPNRCQGRFPIPEIQTRATSNLSLNQAMLREPSYRQCTSPSYGLAVANPRYKAGD